MFQIASSPERQYPCQCFFSRTLVSLSLLLFQNVSIHVTASFPERVSIRVTASSPERQYPCHCFFSRTLVSMSLLLQNFSICVTASSPECQYPCDCFFSRTLVSVSLLLLQNVSIRVTASSVLWLPLMLLVIAHRF